MTLQTLSYVSTHTVGDRSVTYLPLPRFHLHSPPESYSTFLLQHRHSDKEPLKTFKELLLIKAEIHQLPRVPMSRIPDLHVAGDEKKYLRDQLGTREPNSRKKTVAHESPTFKIPIWELGHRP
jgi:hypothetical protein